MTKVEILKKAIEKAIENGYECKAKSVSYYASWLLNGKINRSNYIIFSHSFAKTFWGEDSIEIVVHDNKDFAELVIAWKYHIQQMVLCEEPLDYLKKFLGNGKEKDN